MVERRTIMTVSRHIAEAQKWHPEATGTFTRIMWDLTLAGRIISREVNKAGLADILGAAGGRNVSGDQVQKLDEYAEERIVRALEADGGLCVMASEEEPDVIPIPDAFPKGRYVLVYDPLDGSSNIDVNASVGTIFGLYRRISAQGPGTLEDCLQPARNLVAAGYILYGSSTMLVYTSGQGVNGFTLDPSLGEFLLSHPNMRVPEKGKTYSINEGNSFGWDAGTKRYVSYLKETDPETDRPYTLRYIGTLVADVHRTLLKGGIFLYPSDCRDPAHPKPKLRLLYETGPMAFIIEQAGGRATTGTQGILDLQPTSLHEKAPIILGSKRDVEIYEEFVQGRR